MGPRIAMMHRTHNLRALVIPALFAGATAGCPMTLRAQARSAVAKSVAVPHFRPDPMRPWWDTSPKPPSVLTLVEPARIAVRGTGRIGPAGASAIRTTSGRRLSGTAISGGAYAILAGPSGAVVVRAGQRLDDGCFVKEVGTAYVTLTRERGDRTYEERIQMSDANGARRADRGFFEFTRPARPGE